MSSFLQINVRVWECQRGVGREQGCSSSSYSGPAFLPHSNRWNQIRTGKSSIFLSSGRWRKVWAPVLSCFTRKLANGWMLSALGFAILSDVLGFVLRIFVANFIQAQITGLRESSKRIELSGMVSWAIDTRSLSAYEQVLLFHPLEKEPGMGDVEAPKRNEDVSVGLRQ